MGYRSRSKAVQDAVRMFVSERKWLQQKSGDQTGVLMMLYAHEVKDLESSLTHIQHQYSAVVCSAMHVHLSEMECLEAIAVKGDSKKVQRLSDDLGAERGVRCSD